jgi:uncharacterized protein YecT (DUF1311 family)
MRFPALAISTVCALALFASATAAEEWICDKAMSNAETRHCADREFRKHDAELNRLYKKLLQDAASLGDVGPGYGVPPLEALKQSQRAWVAFRDANCHWKSTSFYGGSGQSVIMSTCLAIATRDRVEELKNATQD